MFGLLKKQKNTAPKTLKSPDPTFIYIKDHDITVRVTTHQRARRFILKQDLKNGGFVLTRPPRSSFRSAEKFVADHTSWLLKHNTHSAADMRFSDGGHFHFYGQKMAIRNIPEKLRGVPFAEDGVFYVPGHPDNMHRKICDFLRDDFRKTISRLAHEKAGRIRTKIRRIRIGDQKTRWGSCSSTGTLSFSCRLVFAPDYVVDYIAAHEVAHMIHMDHSPKFWALCQELYDHGDIFDAKQWLKKNHDLLTTYQMS